MYSINPVISIHVKSKYRKPEERRKIILKLQIINRCSHLKTNYLNIHHYNIRFYSDEKGRMNGIIKQNKKEVKRLKEIMKKIPFHNIT